MARTLIDIECQFTSGATLLRTLVHGRDQWGQTQDGHALKVMRYPGEGEVIETTVPTAKLDYFEVTERLVPDDPAASLEAGGVLTYGRTPEPS